MGRLNCGTFELYYEESGGSKEPVAFVHGSWGDHHQWDGVTSRLTDTFRVITYDRRGRGRSAAPGISLSLEDQLTDLSSLISFVARGPVHLVATDSGATMALRLALTRPDQVRSVNVHEPMLVGILTTDPTTTQLHDEFRDLEERVAAQVRSGDPTGGAQLYSNGVAAEAGGWAELPPDAQNAFATNAVAAIRESADPATQNIELEKFAAYRDPIVVTGGARSAPVFPAVNEHLRAAFYGALQYNFKSAGHFAHITHPEEYAYVLGEFCRHASRLAAQ